MVVFIVFIVVSGSPAKLLSLSVPVVTYCTVPYRPTRYFTDYRDAFLPKFLCMCCPCVMVCGLMTDADDNLKGI